MINIWNKSTFPTKAPKIINIAIAALKAPIKCD